MVTYELLIRSIHAAKVAREKGYDNTADAFDEIVEGLLSLLDAESQPAGAISIRRISSRQPVRLSKRIGSHLLS